jgi:hypothetical protein
MTTTTHYTSRPLLASDAPHVARIDAMQAEHPMSREQIAKMISKQHIGGLVVENSEGVIVAWCMHIRCYGVLDVVRFQRHIEFEGTTPIEMMIDYLTGKSADRLLVFVHEAWIVSVLNQNNFRMADEKQESCVVMEYTP